MILDADVIEYGFKHLQSVAQSHLLEGVLPNKMSLPLKRRFIPRKRHCEVTGKPHTQ